MQADLSTDRLIKLMRVVFAQETLALERRAEIYARITVDSSVQRMELWTNPATPFDEPSVEEFTDESGQLWLFPEFDTPALPIESTVSPLLHGSQI